jgi:hypothetical protein
VYIKITYLYNELSPNNVIIYFYHYILHENITIYKFNGSPRGTGWGMFPHPRPRLPIGWGFFPVSIPAGGEPSPSPSPNGGIPREDRGPIAISIYALHYGLCFGFKIMENKIKKLDLWEVRQPPIIILRRPSHTSWENPEPLSHLYTVAS